MELTIGGHARLVRKGDSYFIPAGVEHAATFRAHTKVIDVFAEPTRYRPKTQDKRSQRQAASRRGSLREEAALALWDLRVPTLNVAVRPKIC